MILRRTTKKVKNYTKRNNENDTLKKKNPFNTKESSHGGIKEQKIYKIYRKQIMKWYS